MAWFGPAPALGLLLGLALGASQAAGQTPTKEYIYLGGRVVAIENPATTGAPPAPTGLTATGGNAQVVLNWTASSGATSYNVYRGTAAGGESASAIATGVGTTSYTDPGLTNGTTYYYEVAAVNASGTSAKSNEASATPQSGSSPPAPTGLTATAGFRQVALGWNASSGATSYKVYRGTTSGGEGSTAIGTATSTSYTDTGLTDGTKYYYKVAGVNANGTGAQSSEASATPVCSPATLAYQNTTLASGTYSACTSITVSPTVTINPTVTLQIVQ
jgi:cellulose 1,4-beta-cellobiosidase